MVLLSEGDKGDSLKVALLAENDTESLMLEKLYECGVKSIKLDGDTKSEYAAWIFSLKKSPRETHKSGELKELDSMWG